MKINRISDHLLHSLRCWSAVPRYAGNIRTIGSEPQSLAVSRLEIARLPLLTFNGRVSIVSVPEHEESVKAAFEGASLLGFDSESRPSTVVAPKNKIALVQLATEHMVCLWRISELKCLPPLLKSILEDPGKIKVAQGATHEIDALREEWGLKSESFIDLHHIALYLKTTPRSLQGLVAIFLKKRLAKDQRLTDWEQQTLTQAQIEYAAIDAWACRQVLINMRSAYGIKRLECERMLSVSSWSKTSHTPRSPEVTSMVEHLFASEKSATAQAKENIFRPATSVRGDVGDLQPLPAQAHQQLAALCVARGYVLRFDGFEPVANGGFRCAFRVEYRRGGTMVAEVFRSKRVHTTIRMAQNDAAQEALACFQVQESIDASSDAATSSPTAC